MTCLNVLQISLSRSLSKKNPVLDSCKGLGMGAWGLGSRPGVIKSQADNQDILLKGLGRGQSPGGSRVKLPPSQHQTLACGRAGVRPLRAWTLPLCRLTQEVKVELGKRTLSD